MKSIDISIDGITISPEEVFPFYQSDPFPGDHRYDLIVAFDDENSAKQFFQKHKLDSTSPNWSFFFLFLQYLWTERGFHNDKPSYFINDVSEVLLTSTSISLKGICSTILSTPGDNK